MPKRKPKAKGRPTSDDRPTGGPTFTTARRPSPDDALAALIESALWDARGDEGTASVVAADAIRAAGYRQVLDGPIESEARAALEASDDPAVRMRHELVFRGARVLDDPENGRYFKSTVEAMLRVLAELAGGDDEGGTGDIVDAIRRAGRGGDGAEVVDSA